MDDLLNGYDAIKAEFDNGSEEEKKAFVDKLETFKSGLGTAFASEKTDFEVEATEVTDHAGLCKIFGEAGAIDY